ncbi:MAG: diguanylate cyclase [Burkholderiaceae bacterium]
MPIAARTSHALRRWFDSLKFQIVLIALVAGVLSALGTAKLVLNTTQADLERLLLANAAENSERTSQLLASKLEMLQLSLKAVARQVPAALWDDAAGLTRFLLDKPALGALFDSYAAIRADGQALVRIENGTPQPGLPNVSDRDYFRDAVRTDQPVVSAPMRARVGNHPIVVMAMSVRDADGSVLGVVIGTVNLESSGLFSNLNDPASSTRVMVVDRQGVILGHPQRGLLLGRGTEPAGLADVVGAWLASGSPIDTRGRAELSLGHLVAMAGIPLSDWTVVATTPQGLALAPLAKARDTAWQSASAVGLLAAAVAGVLAWFMTRPISRLRARAVGLLADSGAAAPDWPLEHGEVGELALAFAQVVAQRQQRESETRALLMQLQAVLDHAQMGIALTRDGRFELVSRQLCQILGCEMAQVVGQPTRMIYPSDEAYQALSDRAVPAFMAHGAFDGELELVRRSGATFWAQMRGRAVVPGDRSKGTIWLIDDVTAVREQRERMAWDSSHDSLTGLANRAAFASVLERATVRSKDEPFCALFIDLDRFKQVNDSGGHAAGDAMLRNVARLLESQVRQTDTVARLGGDEFAVLLHRCPVAVAHTIAEKIRRAVLGFELAFEDRSHSIGASIGLVAVDGSHADSADVLKAADAACYEAKRLGRDRVTRAPSALVITAPSSAPVAGALEASPEVAVEA